MGRIERRNHDIILFFARHCYCYFSWIMTNPLRPMVKRQWKHGEWPFVCRLSLAIKAWNRLWFLLSFDRKSALNSGCSYFDAAQSALRTRCMNVWSWIEFIQFVWITYSCRRLCYLKSTLLRVTCLLLPHECVVCHRGVRDFVVCCLSHRPSPTVWE